MDTHVGIETVAPAAAPALAATACPNCGAPVATPFCGQCGARAAPRLLTIQELVSDVLEDQLSVNGSLLQTLRMLVARPGFLSMEYLAGRVRGYVPPFRLFLALLAVWLLVATYQVRRMQPAIEKAVHAVLAKKAEIARAAGRPAPPFAVVSLPVDTARLPAFARGPLRPVARRYAEINAMDPAAAVTLVVNASLRSANRIVPLVVPIVAALLQLLYFRRRRLYVEHLVFALHLHAFAFLLFAALLLLPLGLAGQALQTTALTVYGLLAMKRFYGDGWGSTVLHAAAFGGLYFLLIVVLSPIGTAFMLM